MSNVSVIVPVYNVEPYLRQCLDSIINQTLKDIEIILIDDGSTDMSGMICDEYGKRDGRIKIIHKTNEGLSSSRNEGIAISTSPYILFVDSDDWVDLQFCEIPYFEAVRNKADLVTFQYYHVKRDKKQKYRDRGIPTGIVDAEALLKCGGSVAWNKLYARDLFDAICFPVGRVHEDIAITHKLILAAKRPVMLSDVLYYYRFRKDSVSHNRILKNKRDGFLSVLEKAEDLLSNGFRRELYETELCSYALTFLAVAPQKNDPYLVKAEEVLNTIQGIPSGLNWKKKAMLTIWKVDKRLFHFICRVTGQKDNKSQEA